MSQDYHQGLFGFSNVFDRSQQQQQQQQQLAQQIRRDKLRVEGFEPPPPLAGIEEEESTNGLPVYETAGMLSEMFNFQARNADNSSGLLENQISQSYRNPRAAPQPSGSASAADWFLHRQGIVNEPVPAPAPAPTSTSSTLHMLLPNPPHGGFGQFSWGGNENNPNEIPGGVVEGLSLSLSSSLQHMNAANSEELRNMGEGGMLFFGQSMGGGGGGGGALHLQGGVVGPAGFGTSVGPHVSMLRSSKYAKAAQELLEEFCSVGRGQFKHNKFSRQNSNNNPNTNPIDVGVSSSSSSSLSAADRLEHQRRKVKLLSMLDEVDRRYNHYCEQMQMVVNSFDMVMGFGAAVPYTTLAQKAMSRHFRCLKDAIAAQLKQSCELLGEKDVGSSGVTKGETPRLRMLEQSLRQQRAFHQMGIMEQEAWRPQRGLPERSVNILRAWLFEHFLHPYPSDADKHLLARQTGLSRSQVSNWFINARVRLWKPMVEEMYQKEAKEETTEEQEQRDNSNSSEQIHDSAAGIMPAAESSAAARGFPASGEIDEASMIRFGASGGDVSLTLGLRHAGNLPDKNPFSVRDFGGC